MSWSLRSLRLRFIAGTAAGLLLISFAYGVFAIYVQNSLQARYATEWMGREIDFFTAFIEDDSGKLHFRPFRNDLRSRIYALWAYDEAGNVLWSSRELPEFAAKLQPAWLDKPGLYEIEHPTLLPGSRDQEGVEIPSSSVQHHDEFSYYVLVKHYPAHGDQQPLRLVLIDTTPQEREENAFFWHTLRNVTLLNLFILLPLVWVAARWSLLPIARLARAVSKLEKGEGQRLDFIPPAELSRLVNNLNLLLQQQRRQLERYRHSLGDLAHSIKTPLAVLQTSFHSLRGHPERMREQEPLLLEQISRIDQQIGYYLRRATASRDLGLIRQQHELKNLIAPLCSALQKVYDRKGVVLTLSCPEDLFFYGDRNDFQEMVGNVIENACKYCLEYVQVRCTQADNMLVIQIEDDGPGVPDNRRQQILQRGVRIDTLKPGQGIGLAVVCDILESYEGQMLIDVSELGGARFTLCFKLTSRPHGKKDRT